MKIILALISLLFIIPKYSFAVDVFNLTYNLTEGGYELELTPANPYKGVKIQVDSNINTQYEIIQKITAPIENRRNPGVFIRNNFVIRRISEGTSTGTFYVQTNDMPVHSIERIYTSPTTGPATNFTLVYGITQIQDIEPGEYFGRIAFTLRGGAREPVTKILDVYVTIGEREGERPTIEIIPESGLRTISLNSRREDMKVAHVLVKINGRFKNLFSIGQVITKPLESTEGNRLDFDAVNFVVREAGKGMPVSEPRPLTLEPQDIYTSAPAGETDEHFVITYTLADLSQQKAGRYTSHIQYLLAEPGGEQKLLERLDLEVQIERIFDFIITTQGQTGRIEFSNLTPKEPPKRYEVTIEIITNIGKQYQINQNVYSDLSNKEGNVISSKYFTLKTESLDTKGRLKFPVPEEAKKGEMVLFVSDAQGSPDKFKIIYEATCPWDIKAGDYSTSITYSLLEI